MRRAASGLTIGAVLSSLVSLALPLVLKTADDLWWVWSAGCGFLGLLLLASPVVKYMHASQLGLFWLGSFGIVHAVSNSVPYALVTVLSGDKRGGRALGILNVFVCVPQIFVSTVAGPLNSTLHSDLPAFLLGGACALGAARLLQREAERIVYESVGQFPCCVWRGGGCRRGENCGRGA
jgi:solute carrier family 45 protein 1/2/4